MKKTKMHEKNGVALIQPVGHMTFYYLEEMADFVKLQIKKRNFRFIFDFTQTIWVDSIGMGIVAMAVKAAVLRRSRVFIVGPNETIRNIFKITTIIDLVEEAKTVEEATAKLLDVKINLGSSH